MVVDVNTGSDDDRVERKKDKKKDKVKVSADCNGIYFSLWLLTV
jgi:hypothetical protein